MKYLFTLICILILGLSSSEQDKAKDELIRKGNVIYDFTLAQLSKKYITTNDTFVLSQITGTDGIKLLYDHAYWSGNNSEKLSLRDFAIKIIDRDNNLKNINSILRNIRYAKDSIASIGKNGVTDPLSPKSIDPSSPVALTPPLQFV